MRSRAEEVGGAAPVSKPGAAFEDSCGRPAQHHRIHCAG